ncbi:hypothetical protein Paz_11 [Xylella phage Paz]|uniref:Uncharacterized protein n=1 Tax=Xylella phage Paz TaxID=1415145 RepID=V5Q7P0_9CAUD|nr:hypothetical protein Paz_11 [Xylella phage Paz]AHB12108.1 hypothetical protein Paz_11 [Xylella phage Paz]
MSKQFKQYIMHALDTDGELKPIGVFTYPAGTSDKQVKAAVSSKVNRAPENLFISDTTLVELR